MDGIITIRQSLGGAGYTNWSGIPSFFDDYSPAVTFEGDNTVMSQQCFNYLIKMAQKVVKGKDTQNMLPIFKYLDMINHVDELKCKATTALDFVEPDQVIEAI